MTAANDKRKPMILILATEACAYPGADNTGQIHAEYTTDAYIVRVPAPVQFNEEFYLRCFDKGFDGILVMTCGHECPYAGAYDRTAQRIGKVHELMKERGMDPLRLRICAICTVCSKAFLKEVNAMIDLVSKPEPAAVAE